MDNQRIQQVVAPIVESFGCELWAVEYLPQGDRALLQVFVDKTGGVTLDDCKKISKQLGTVLEVEGVIRGQYLLEVSSPGIGRRLYQLAHYQRYLGEEIKLTLHQAQQERRHLKGIIREVEQQHLVLEVAGQIWQLPFDNIAKASVVDKAKP